MNPDGSGVRQLTFDAGHGGTVIDTETYLVATDEVTDLVTTNGWACWPAYTPNIGIPRIAQQITDTILQSYPGLGSRMPPTADQAEAQLSTDTTSAAREITRLVREHGRANATPSEKRVARALELHAAGITTQAQAAALIPCSPTTLSEDFHKLNIKSPWPPGGSRPGAGRPPRNQVPPPDQAPTAWDRGTQWDR
jgi:hypothetical protein